MPRRRPAEPVQSDRTILMTVEDLIGLAMNTSYHNVVNFKLVQMILHILARQLRLLEQHVQLSLDSDEDLDMKSRKTSPPRRGRRGRASLSPPGRRASTASKRSKSAKREGPEDSTTTDEGGKKERRGKGGDKDEKGGSKYGAKEGSKTRAETDSDQDAGRRKRGGKDERSQERRDDSSPRDVRRDRDEKGGSERGGKRGGEEADSGRSRGRESRRGTVASLNIREKDNVLFAEKGPRRTEGGKRVGSIDVATASQLDALREDVRRLQRLAAPPPQPALPSDMELRSELAAGTASLSDTVNAMQLAARIQAAEEAAQRLAEMVTAVAVAGGLPEPMGLDEDQRGATHRPDKNVAIGTDVERELTRRKSVAISALPPSGAPSRANLPAGRPSSVAGGARPSLTPRYSVVGAPGVTKDVMEEALEELRDELMRTIGGATSKASAAADLAAHTAKNVSERLDVAVRLSQRISTLQALVADYAEQLSGFGGGLETQMSSFQEQMASMRGDLTAGLVQLEQVNTNKETLAVMELTERYTGLVAVLDETLHEHGALSADMRALAAQLEALRAAAESLGEQKSDRDEVVDGLRDKADLTRLAGLLPGEEFRAALADLEERLALCHRKFSRQEAVWQGALSDLNTVMSDKADLTAVMAAREEALRLLLALQQMLQKLELAVGEPKAAMLTRKMARDAACGACQDPALMEPVDQFYGAPPRLPALRPPPPTSPPPSPPQPTLPMCEWEPQAIPEQRAHACHRWVGGSHTLLGGSSRAPAPPLLGGVRPTRKYLAAGDDNRLYKCEEELQPCLECNAPPALNVTETGAGDKTG